MKAWLTGLVLVALIVIYHTIAFAQLDDAAAQQAYAAGDYKTAKIEYFSLVAHDPDSGLGWLGLARTCVQLSEWDEALAAFERAAGLVELDAAAHTEYGDTLKQLGHMEEAIEQYKLAVSDAASGAKPESAKPASAPAKSVAQQPAPEKAPAGKPAVKPAAPVKAVDKPVAKPAKQPAKQTAPAQNAKPPAAAKKTSTDDPTVTAREVPATPAGQHDNKDASYDLTGQAAAAEAGTAQVEFLAPFEPGGSRTDPRPGDGVVQVFHAQQASASLQDSKSDDGGQGAPAADTPADPLAQARAFVADKRWAEAVTAYEQYLQLGTADEAVRLEYAGALRESGDTQRSEDEYNRLLHANPDSIEAKIGLAKVLGKNQQITEAMYLLDQIFVDKQTYPKVQLARSYIYFVNDYISEAIAMIGEVQGYDPDNAEAKEMLAEYTVKLDASMGWDKPGPLPDDPSLRGEYQYNQGEREQAKRDFEQAVRTNPADYHAWQRLANLYRWDNQWPEAIDAYLKYLKLNPTDYDARLRYAQSLLSNGDVGEAQDELWSLITDPGTPVEVYNEALLSYATALTAAGQAKDALTWYEQALRFDPHNNGARAGYASALAASRHYDKAQEQYRWILEEDPGSQAARLGLAQTYAWSGDLKNAIRYYDDIDQSSNYYSAALVGKSFAYLWSGKRDKAVALAGEVARIDPANPDLPTLFERLNEKPAPELAALWRQSHDSDDNDYSGSLTRITVPLDARGTSATLSYEDLKVDNSAKGQASSGSNTKLTLNVPVGENIRLSGSVNKVDLHNNDGSKTDKWNYSTSGRAQLNDHLTVGASYEDRTLYDTAELARNQVSVQEWAANGEWTFADGNTKLFAQYSRGKMNDHNTRDSRVLRLSRYAEWQERGRLDYGLAYRTLDYSWNVSNGYWDPDNYRIYESYFDWVDKSRRRVKLDASVGLGLQKDTGSKFSGVFRYSLGLRSGFYGDRLQLRTGYSNSNAEDSATSAPGYQWKSWYLGADYHF